MSLIRIINWTNVFYNSDQYDHVAVTMQSVVVPRRLEELEANDKISTLLFVCVLFCFS